MKKLLISSIILFFLGVNIYAQNFDSALERYGNEYVSERVWLHFDKSVYAPGEVIWYKGYVMEGIFPAAESKNLYVDWTNEKGTLIYRSVSPIVNGSSNSQFELPVEYAGEALHVKAYTKWMLNFDSAFLFRKNIPVISTAKKGSSKKEPSVASLRFFPEGGAIVAGLENKVAFKANDQYGNPVVIKGVVLNSKNKVIDSLFIQHDGMGFIVFTPELNEKYIAKWKDENGREVVTPLPEINKTGVVLRVEPTGVKRRFTVLATPDMAGEFTVLGTMNQQAVFKIQKDIGSGSITGLVPVSDLISGILTITILDNQMQPLAERIIFIDNKEYLLEPKLEVVHWGLNKRARNEIEISIPDSIFTGMSISVTDADIQKDTSNNIISYLLLSSEIKGKIHNPAYYFNPSSVKEKEIDLVMLTNGWRRYKWEDLAQGKLPPIPYPRDSSYLTLSGKIIGGRSSQFQDAGDIILVVKPKTEAGRPEVLSVPVLSNGTFNDPSIVVFDTAQVYYQFPKKRELDDLVINFLPDKLPPLSYGDSAKSIKLPDTTGAAYWASIIAELESQFNQYKGEVLENVIVKAKTKSKVEEMDEKYTSALFSGDGQKFDLVNDPVATAAMNIFTYLQGRVAGLQINNAMSGSPTLSWRGGTPGVFLDEMPADASMLASVPVTDIAYVKIFRPPFLGSTNGGGGAIAIYTRRGNDMKADPGKGLSSTTVVGYTGIKDFYSPNYASFTEENLRRDIRTTLYWNPQLNFDAANRKAKVVFYNNDITSAFWLVMEGMTADGRLVHYKELLY